jgi:hypothetical protein
MTGINHKRLDEVLTWAPQLQVEATCAAEFEALRRVGKPGEAQRRRMEHLEKHLDRGDVICECYETVTSID